MATTTYRKGTFQMLWDCPVCGSRKLLGVDHRHCPHCGAPQEENLRYFPSPEDRVATDFRGEAPDWECDHCGVANGSEAGFCGGCGAPRGNATTVHVRASIPAGQGETGEQAAREWQQRKAESRAARAARAGGRRRRHASPLSRLVGWARGLRRRPGRVVGLAVGAVSLLLLCFAVCDREVALRVEGHSWARFIPVERYSTLTQSDWCSATPYDARIHARTREIHHYDRIPDGEDCRTEPERCSESCRNVDHGNGGYSEVCTQTCSPARTVCTTRYRQEPVYADKCHYQVDRWVVVRSAERRGTDLRPAWPDEPAYAGCPVTAIGCERIGARYGLYLLHYVSEDADDEDRERFECTRAEQDWQATSAGARFVGEVSRMTDTLDCDALVPAP